MKFPLHKSLPLLLLMFAFSLAAGPVYTPVKMLSSSVEEKMPHGLWMSGINGATFKREKEDETLVMRLKGRQGVVNFNKHTPLALNFPEGAKISMRVRALQQGAPVRVAFEWSYADKKRSRQTAANYTPSAEFQTVLLALPVADQEKATGFWITFAKEGEYEITDLAVVQSADLAPDPVASETLLKSAELVITGKAADGVRTVAAKNKEGRILVETTPAQGGFRLSVPKELLESGKECVITLEAVTGAGKSSLELAPVFVHPTLKDASLPQVVLRDGKLFADGRYFAFTGTNYTDFMLGMSVRKSLGYESIGAAVRQMAEWKMKVARVTLNIGMIQPAEGVFPGDPKWEEVMRKHKLRTDTFHMLEYFITVAGDHGIYTVFDFHGVPKDPYRYFLGGQPADREAGKPGAAVAWLYEEGAKPTTFVDVKKPRELKALQSTFQFLARHFKGNPNILGFEVPYNEPHDAYMSIPANYNRITGEIIRIIQSEDPERLTFSMPPGWGHDNATWPATFLPPDGLSGGGPHFYIGNGPVPLRPEAKNHKEPWLCRDVPQTFEYGMTAALMPYSGVGYPVFNGEGGEHGHRSFLPDLTPDEAATLMIDGTLTQSYASGLAGALQWTMWSERLFKEFEKVYGEQYTRWGDVYNAGPIDWSRAEIAVIQNAAAVPINNSYNYSCVPFARLMLDLHLGGAIRYLTDDQIIFNGLTNVSAGLEQVSEATMDGNHKAYIVDRRNLDSRVLQALKKIKTPILWTDDPEKLDTKEVAEFLKKSGIAVNTRSTSDVQLIEGPGHLVLYRRRGDKPEATVYPLLKRKGDFSLTDEAGKTLFKGNAESLYRDGIKTAVSKWRSSILRIDDL